MLSFYLTLIKIVHNLILVLNVFMKQKNYLSHLMHEALRGYSPLRWGATSQLDLPSLTPLSVAGCGRLQLRVPHWPTSVDY